MKRRESDSGWSSRMLLLQIETSRAYPGLPREGLLRTRFLRDRGAVGARISSGKVHIAAAVTNNGRTLAHREAERLEQLDLMSALCQTRANVGGNSLLHFDVATVKGFFCEAGLLQCGLDVHPVVDNVGNKLRVSLRLVPGLP